MARYWELGDRRFCFTDKPRFECPHESITYEFRDPTTGEVTVTSRRPEERVGITFSRHVPAEWATAAAALDVDGAKLLAAVQRVHRGDGGRCRVNGKLTNRCKACGAKLIAHGYSAYVEELVPEDERDEMQRANARLAATFGTGGVYRRVKGVQVDTKREAKQWAWDEFVLARNAAAEGAVR